MCDFCAIVLHPSEIVSKFAARMLLSMGFHRSIAIDTLERIALTHKLAEALQVRAPHHPLVFVDERYTSPAFRHLYHIIEPLVANHCQFPIITFSSNPVPITPNGLVAAARKFGLQLLPELKRRPPIAPLPLPSQPPPLSMILPRTTFIQDEDEGGGDHDSMGPSVPRLPRVQEADNEEEDQEEDQEEDGEEDQEEEGTQRAQRQEVGVANETAVMREFVHEQLKQRHMHARSFPTTLAEIVPREMRENMATWPSWSFSQHNVSSEFRRAMETDSFLMLCAIPLHGLCESFVALSNFPETTPLRDMHLFDDARRNVSLFGGCVSSQHPTWMVTSVPVMLRGISVAPSVTSRGRILHQALQIATDEWTSRDDVVVLIDFSGAVTRSGRQLVDMYVNGHSMATMLVDMRIKEKTIAVPDNTRGMNRSQDVTFWKESKCSIYPADLQQQLIQDTVDWLHRRIEQPVPNNMAR